MATFAITGTPAPNASIAVTVTDAAIVGIGKYELQWASVTTGSPVLLDAAPSVGTGTLTGHIEFTGEVALLRPHVLAAGMLYLWDLSSASKNTLLGHARCPVICDSEQPT